MENNNTPTAGNNKVEPAPDPDGEYKEAFEKLPLSRGWNFVNSPTVKRNKTQGKPTLQATDDQDDMNEEEKEKIKQVFAKMRGIMIEKEDFETFQELNSQKWVDPTPDLVEGIFYVN